MAWQRSKQDCIERRYNCIKNASIYFCTEASARMELCAKVYFRRGVTALARMLLQI